MKRKIRVLIMLGLFITGCSHILDVLWNPEAADFTITATSNGPNQIRITFLLSDHNNTLANDPLQDNDAYFWGYYIYRNASSPYDDYTLIGIDYLSDSTGTSFLEKRGTNYYVETLPAPGEGGGAGLYTDTSCESGETYFYRVVVIYRAWDEDATPAPTWKSSLDDSSASSWAAAVCE